jgi:hypothetical protein
MAGSVSVPVELHVGAAAPVSQQFRLAAPYDVTGIDVRQIIRTEPPDGTQNFEPNFLAAVEFDRPDFPWLFTPASPDAQGRLRPWICLVVIAQGTGVSIVPGGVGLPPVLDLRQPASLVKELPDLEQSWAWAHGQVTGAARPSDVDGVDAQTPERTLSRLVCPRRLDPDTAYFACVVPTFKAGRKTGLGLALTNADLATLQPAWKQDDIAAQIPIYFLWQFRTGPTGDFASLVKLLKAYEFPTSAGTRPMFVGAAGQGLPTDSSASVSLESALLPLGTNPGDWTGVFADSFRAAMRTLINVPTDPTADPLLTPPLYAGQHAGQLRPPVPGIPPRWLADLNLNPQHRAVAAWGTRVVQDQQEGLMASAWDQAGDIRRANTMLRHAQLVRRGSQALHTNYLSKLPASTLLELSHPVHTRITVAAQTTVRGLLVSKQVPLAVMNRQFRVAVRPWGPLMRTVLAPAQRILRPVTARVASGSLLITILQPPFAVVTPEDAEARYKAGGGTRAANLPPVNFLQMQVFAFVSVPQRPVFSMRPPELPGVHVPPPPPPPPIPFGLPDNAQAKRFRAAVIAHQQMLGPAVMVFKPFIPAVNIDSVTPAVLDQTNPSVRIPQWVRPLIQRSAQPAGDDSLDPIGLAPQFPQPMYEALRDLSPEMIVPTLSEVPDNTVSLLKTNPRCVEGFLAGLNHEMSRELLWRGYPADFRATYFQNFWDRRAAAGTAPTVDIPPISTWPGQKRLGDMAAGADNLLVLMIRGEITRRYPDAIIYMVQALWPSGQPRPSLGAQELHPVMAGVLEPDVAFFGFAITQNDAMGSGNSSQPGWFFVIQEHPCAPRFGVEPAAPPAALTPGANSASTANAYLQPPVRMAIHARDLLSKT